MGRRLFGRCGLALALMLSGCTGDEKDLDLPEGYWRLEQIQPILDRTVTVRIEPDLTGLSQAEHETMRLLLETGAIMHRLYVISRHPQALAAHEELAELHERLGSPRTTQGLLDLFRVFRGPIAQTLDNKREPFLPVDAEPPGKNVYPWGIDKASVEVFLSAHPEQRASLLAPRAVVRQATPENLADDLARLDANPGLDLMHPGLGTMLEELRSAPGGQLYALPYSVAYAEELVEAYGLLREAAQVIAAEDPDFADYLRNRARDLISDDYEAGDAAWVRGRFTTRLNAQIGSYETYDDALYGTKSFFALSVLVRDEARTTQLAEVLADIQSLEDALPYDDGKSVDTHIPVGVYRVVADFGQARSANTASILPNEPDLARKYGRRVLLRYNLLGHPKLFADSLAAYVAAVARQHAEDYTFDGRFNYTLWHEIGHYLGPDVTRDGRDPDAALEAYSDLIEELKADLVSLYSGRALLERGYHDDAGLKAHYAAGIRRVLQRVEPRRVEQPYQTMQLMQMNFFLEQGLLEFDPDSKRLRTDYERYHDVVAEMLRQVLEIQRAGDPARAAEFVERYAEWKPDLHQVLAQRIDAASGSRYRLIRYSALDE